MKKLAFFRTPGAGIGLWDYARRPLVLYPDQTIAINAPQWIGQCPDSVTQWHPEGTYSPVPLPSKKPTANFYATSPQAFQPYFQTNWDHFWGLRATTRQTFALSTDPGARGPGFGPSTVYDPLPSYGAVAPKLGQ